MWSSTPCKNEPPERGLRETIAGRRTCLTAGLAGLLAGTSLTALRFAQAQPSAPVPVAAELPDMQWSGSSRMRFFGFDIYDVALWVAPGFRAGSFAEHGLALELTYLRPLSGHAIAQRSLQEMRRAGELTQARAQRWLATMQEAFPDVMVGDRITGLHRPGVGARFWHNGQLRKVVPDPEFSRLFFGIWLSETTSEPQLRTALLSRAAP